MSCGVFLLCEVPLNPAPIIKPEVRTGERSSHLQSLRIIRRFRARRVDHDLVKAAAAGTAAASLVRQL
jgi:hypothetical protein